MAKFLYKMQSILNIKYKLESQAKTNFTNAANKLREEQEKLDEFRKRKEYYEEKARGLMLERLNVLEIKKAKVAIEKMNEAIKMQLVTVKVAEKNLEAARLRLNEVMIDRKTHEKLKENAFEEFVKEMNASEGKEIDELVSYSYNNGND